MTALLACGASLLASVAVLGWLGCRWYDAATRGDAHALDPARVVLALHRRSR
jgi:hypothetical protein